MTDPAFVAAYRTAMARRGVKASVQRITGAAPNVTVTSADDIVVVVTGDAPSAPEGYSGTGQITRGQRQVMVMAADLAAKNFPLPVRKNDKVVLVGATEKLNVEVADAETKRLAGAIDLTVSGVS